MMDGKVELEFFERGDDDARGTPVSGEVATGTFVVVVAFAVVSVAAFVVTVLGLFQ